MTMFSNSSDNDRFLRALESIAHSMQPTIILQEELLKPVTTDFEADGAFSFTCTRCEKEQSLKNFAKHSVICDKCRGALEEAGFVGDPVPREKVHEIISSSCDEGPPLEEVADKMIRLERVLAHNRIRLAKYAQEQLQRPYIPLAAWAATVQEVLGLLHPRAPDNSVLIEQLVWLYDDIKARQ
jgi:hypothetical protein